MEVMVHSQRANPGDVLLTFVNQLNYFYQWTVTGDLNKSADLAIFKKSEKSHIIQHPFGNPAPNMGWKLYDMIEVIHGFVVQ